MHLSKTKYCLAPLFLLYLFGHVSTAGIWQDIISTATNVAKDARVTQAGEACAAGSGEDSCSIPWRTQRRDESSAVAYWLLECNLVVDVLGSGVGICQVKSWIISLAISLIIGIPLIILACICCCCCGLCCCCRRQSTGYVAAPLKSNRRINNMEHEMIAYH